MIKDLLYMIKILVAILDIRLKKLDKLNFIYNAMRFINSQATVIKALHHEEREKKRKVRRNLHHGE